MHDLGLRHYLRILWRRRWLVALSLVVVPLAAVAFSLRQPAVYQASADVLLRYQSLPSTLSGITDPNSYSYYIDPVRSTDTQLQIAELPTLATRVDAALKRRGVVADSAGSTSVESVGDTDVIRFTSETGSATTAALIASEYARQFVLYHEQLDTAAEDAAFRPPRAECKVGGARPRTARASRGRRSTNETARSGDDRDSHATRRPGRDPRARPDDCARAHRPSRSRD